MASAVLYGADWCGACAKAEAHLRARGVTVTKKDVSGDGGTEATRASNRTEMFQRVSASGKGDPMLDIIPTIDLGGANVFQGFSAHQIDQALGLASPGQPTDTPEGVPNKEPGSWSPTTPDVADFFAGLGLGGMSTGLLVLAVLWALSKKR